MIFSKRNNPVSLARSLVASLRTSRLPSFRQCAHFKKVLTPSEVLMLRVLGIIILINLIFLNIHLYQTATIPTPSSGGTYKEGMLDGPRFINPILAAEHVDLELSSLIFSSLFRYDPLEQKLIGDLVSQYSTSPDGRVYTLVLKDKVTWHDNTPFSLDDVLFTLGAIKDEEYKSPLYLTLKDVEIKKINNNSLELKLPEPYAPFLSTLTFGIAPKHIFENISPSALQLTSYNTKPVGTGPFMFKKFYKDKQGAIHSLELTRNTNYINGAPFISNLIITFFPNREELLLASKQKAIDGFGFIVEPGFSFEEYPKSQFHIFKPAFAQYTAIFFNQKNNPWLQEPLLRQALMKSIDKQKLAQEIYKNGLVLIDGPLLPGITPSPLPGADNVFSSSRAEELFAQLKEKIEKQTKQKKSAKSKKTEEKPPEEIKITLTTANTPQYIEVAQNIKKGWEALGLKIDLQTIEIAKLKKEIIKSRDYEALLFSVKPGANTDPFPFWHSSQRDWPGTNLAMFSSKEADQLLKEARTSSLPEERREKYLAFQKIIQQEIPAIFLWAPRYIYIISEAVKGVDFRYLITAADRFTLIQEWYLKEKRAW
jgi:peptide/nickel transport system substrate-binding protein